MMFNEGYRDRVLVCRDCGNEFTFTAGEQEFYASKGLTNSPSRCSSCRAARRGGQQNAPRSPREQHEAVCANCGRATTVPFVPREDRPVYCSDCFQSQRASSPRRDDSRSYGGNSSYNSNSGYSSNSGYNDNNSGYSGGRDRRERRDRW